MELVDGWCISMVWWRDNLKEVGCTMDGGGEFFQMADITWAGGKMEILMDMVVEMLLQEVKVSKKGCTNL